jgi:hypothetical protein
MYLMVQSQIFFAMKDSFKKMMCNKKKVLKTLNFQLSKNSHMQFVKNV